MSPKIKGDDVQLFVIQSVYKTLSPRKKKDALPFEPKEQIKKFVREAWCKVWFDKTSLGPYGEYIGSKGEVVKNRSMIFSNQTQSYYTVAHSIKELEEVLLAKRGEIGYAIR